LTGLDFDRDGHSGFTVGYTWIKTGRQVLTLNLNCQALMSQQRN